MKRLLFLPVLAALPLLPCPAQQGGSVMTTDSGEVRPLPRWLIEFSNLPRETRARYIALFNLAKKAYREGRFVDAMAYMVDCEVIQRGNPGVWNLRACCLMEQKFFEEAAAELERVLKEQPDDHAALMNLASMHMACGRYTKSLELLAQLREALPCTTNPEVLNLLDFRALLCHLMLGQDQEARALVAHLTPMADTPLYYYGRAAFALAEGKMSDYEYCLTAADNIFANNRATEPYRRTLLLSGLQPGKVPSHPR